MHIDNTSLTTVKYTTTLLAYVYIDPTLTTLYITEFELYYIYKSRCLHLCAFSTVPECPRMPLLHFAGASNQ